MKKISHKDPSVNNVPSHSTLFTYAIKRCLMRPHAPKEVLSLLEKKFGPVFREQYKHVLRRLEELGYTGEMLFAHALLKNRLLYKHKGLHFIQQELRKYEISPHIIQEVLPLYQEEEEQSLRKAFEKKYRSLPDTLTQEKKKEKLLSHLQRRGFSVQQIMKYLHSQI